MTSLELRAMAYTLAALLFLALGVRLGMHHVQAQWNIDKLAQAAVVAKQQADVTAALEARDKLQTQVEQSHAQLIQNGSALTGTLNDSMRSVEAALREYTLRAAMANSPGAIGASTITGSDPRIDAAITGVEIAVSHLSAACVHDSAELTSVLSLAPTQTPPKPSK